MYNQSKRKLHLKGLLTAVVLASGLSLATTAVNATAVLTGSVNGVPSGNHYENFDSVPLGDGTYTTPSGIKVSFIPDAKAVQGAASGLYAPPVLSNNNGTLFGNPENGTDATTYLTSGSTGTFSNAGVSLLFPTPERYMGLLWGSVDKFNTLTFYSGAELVAQFTGNDVTTAASGDQGANGTFYVNISSTLAFDRVVATSSSHAFEFDNVAFNANPLKVPEPGIAGVFLLGLLLVGSGYWFKGRRLT